MSTQRLTLPLITVIAPITWGTTYLATDKFLPEDRPLFAALVRALPVGLLIVASTRTLPRGEWWWKSAVLGLLNVGIFFPLIFLSAYNLPGGIAATVQALLPFVIMAIAWPTIGERPTSTRAAAASLGLLGVGLLVVRSPDGITALGLGAAITSVFCSAFGWVLVKKWGSPVPGLTFVGWQLAWGGLAIAPVALLVEGAPPQVDVTNVLGYAWIALVATGLAYLCWFHGLARMPAASVALLGLVNPFVATVLGVAFNDETFGPIQAIGAALVLSGVVLGQVSFARRSPDEPADPRLEGPPRPSAEDSSPAVQPSESR